MSESRGFPAELLSFLAFGVLGVAVTAAALACFAQLMAGQGCSGGSADTCHNSCVHGQFVVCTGGDVP